MRDHLHRRLGLAGATMAVFFVSGVVHDLIISLQRHATNPNAISLAGKQITITSGDCAGETATIVAYDAERTDYILDRQIEILGELINRWEGLC